MSNVWGTVYQMERDKATGNDPDSLRAEIARLRQENWQLKGALGYPVPGDVPQGDFKCGLCEARDAEIERMRRERDDFAARLQTALDTVHGPSTHPSETTTS